MKIQLDTTNKTIKVEEAVNLAKFMDLVKKILPDNEWKQFKLETNTTIQSWSYPVYVEKHFHPWQQPWWSYSNSDSSILMKTNGINGSVVNRENADNRNALYSKTGGTGASYSLNSGVYNIEAKE